MRRFLFIVSSIVLCFILHARNKRETRLYGEILNGKIKTLTEKHIYKNGIETSIYHFNELGLLAQKEELRFLPDEKFGLNQKMINIYDSDNQKIKTISYDQDGKETYINEFSYKDGNLVKHMLKHPRSTAKITYYFDYEETRFKYDKKRNLIEKKTIIKEKKLIRVRQKLEKYQYDSMGNCIVEEEFDKSGAVVQRKSNKYLNNKLVETLTWQLFEGEDLYLKDIYEHNEDGTLKSQIHVVYVYGSMDEEDHRDTENYSYAYKYDAEGRPIEETKTTSRNDVIANVHNRQYSDFDDEGNWRKQKIGKVIIERAIEYYDDI